MRTRDFREVQVSSSLLVFIFLAVLALGVVVFLLGVSVGKKQVELADAQRDAAEKVRVEQPVSPPAEGQKPAETASPGVTATPGESGAKAAVQSPAQTGAAPSAPPKTEAPPTPTSQEKPREVTAPKTEAKAAKAEPSKTPAAKPSGAVEAGLWYVQVGALESRAGAQTHAAPFRKQGYNVIIRDPLATDRRPIYRVWIGGYATKAQAQDVILKLNAASKKRTGYYPIKG